MSTPPPDERELAALADGSLPDSKRRAAEQRVNASPELEGLLAEQRRAVAAIRRASVPAPGVLRERVEAARRRARGRPGYRRWTVTVPAAAAAAAASTALLLALPGGGPGTPTVVAAATTGAKHATGPAPARAPGSQLLKLQAYGVPYPNWTHPYRWRAAGTRVDLVGDRSATTVFYRRGTGTIAYTIVSGRALPWPAASRTVVENGVAVHLFAAGGRNAVTWTRLGHTCVLSGAAPRATLAELAAWRGAGRVPF